MSAGIQNSKKSKGKTKQNNPQEIPPSLTGLLPNLHNVKLIQRNAVAEPRILALWVTSRSGLNAKWIQCRQIATRNSCNSCTWNCNSNLCLSHLVLIFAPMPEEDHGCRPFHPRGCVRLVDDYRRYGWILDGANYRCWNVKASSPFFKHFWNLIERSGTSLT